MNQGQIKAMRKASGCIDAPFVLNDVRNYYNGVNMKIVFFGHPYSDNPKRRKAENKLIIRILHDKYPDVIFISPLMMFDYFDDDSQRTAVMNVCKCIIREMADEYWYTLESPGVLEEIQEAIKSGKPVIKKGNV